MTKRFRDDDEDEDDELKPVFVDTSLDTHLVVLVSPLLSFSLLKERIVMEHFNCFPNFGEIKIDALKVKREQKYYHLSDSMLIKVAFHGVEGWFVYADVSVTSFDKPSKALSITVKKLQPNLTLQKHVPTLQMPENAYKNIEKEAAKSDSPGDDPRQHGKKSSKRHKTETTPVKSTPKFEDNNARKASLMETQGIVLPSKVVEVSAAGDVDTSSVSTDAAAETDTAKRRCEVLRQSEGTVKSLKTLSSDLNQETAVHIVSRVKKFRRKLKGDGDGVDKSHVLKSGEGPDITRNDVSAFDSGKITSGKGINDEDVTPLKSSEVEVTESENTSKKMKTSKGSRRENNDLESANTTLKGTSTNAGGFCNEVSEVDNPVAASGSPAKKKKKNKKDVDGVNGRDAAQLGRVPDVMQNGVTTLDSETLGISEIESDNKRTGDAEIEKSEDIAKKKKKKTHKTKTSVTENEDLSTPRHNNDRELSDSRQEVAEFSQKGFSKTEQSADTMSKSEDEAKKKKKKTHKTKTSVTENEGLSSPRHNNDRELAGSRQEAAEFLQTGGIIKTEQSADTMSKSEDEAKKKKKKTHKTKTSVTENVDLSTPRHNNDREVADSRQEAAEFSQTGGISKIEQSADTLSKSRARSPSKQKSHLEDSSGFPLKERFNEKMKENAAPETVSNINERHICTLVEIVTAW
ncbi:hypothetical protein RND81_11G009800 [Saponaria officinalis]|uniref:Uncharacterized protein n=1 Tax=Saponaria officinalis TaxID=3572 RepID=A0AAW1HGG4_SAPOF